MKKVIFTMLFTLIAMVVNAQDYTFSQRQKYISFGIQYAMVDQNSNKIDSHNAFVINMSIYGVYADLGLMSPKHNRSVEIDKWRNEHSVESFHFGFQLPITQWLRITPIMGYYNHESGYTDGHDWGVDKYGVYNKFHTEKQSNGPDCGVNVELSFDYVSLYGTYTEHMWYAGIGVNIPIYKILK